VTTRQEIAIPAQVGERAIRNAPALPRARPGFLERLGSLRLAAVGVLAAVTFVCLFGHTHVVPGQIPPSSWFGLLSVPGSVATRGFLSIAAWMAAILLALCWYGFMRNALAGRLSVRVAAATAAVWAAPFAIGPPLTSLDIYSFAAQGKLLQGGDSPYVRGPAALGHGDFLAAVDPRWRNALSPYGPVGLRFEWLSALLGRGDATATVVWLRVLTILCVAGAIVLAVALASPARRPLTVVLLAMNPLLLVTGVSAGHLEALMLVMMLAAVLAERRHRPVLALVLSVAAGLVKAPALLLTVFLVVEHLRAAAPYRARRFTALRDGAAVVGALAAGTLLIPKGWGWIGTAVQTPASGRALWTPSTAVAEVFTAFGRWFGVDPSLDHVLSVTRLIGDVAALAVVIILLRRSGNYEARLGAALVAVAVLGVVLYPWYLLWGIPILIVSARRRLTSFVTLAVVVFATIYLWPEPKEAVAAGGALVGTLGKDPLVELLFLVTVAVAAAQFLLWRRVVSTRLAALAD